MSPHTGSTGQWTYRGFKIRWRNITTRTATGPYRGPECQIVDARQRVIARFDLASQAEAWINRKLDA
jgi:hypothetical protein